MNRRFILEPREGVYVDDGYYRVSDYELATGWVAGYEDPRPCTASEVQCSPREGFEAALLPALRRTPCVVAFSGGRDSSAILAVATQVARREGLPDPIPATHDFAGQGIADERVYQELVVRHLGLREWHKVTDADSFDVLGDRAREGLRRHGLLWPALLHYHAPLAELASDGGSLVVGEGGDEVLGNQRMTSVQYVLKARNRPGPRTLRLLSDVLAPRRVRQARLHREYSDIGMHPWLDRDLAADFVSLQAANMSAAPLRWDSAVRRHARQRAVVTGAANLRRVLAESDVSYHEPFLDPTFLDPFARAGGMRGWITRTAMMRMLFGDVLPDEICRRDQKARFGAVAVGEPSREFLRSWTGEGIDPDVVNIDEFVRAASAESPLYGVLMLLQAAWLATEERLRAPASAELS